MRRGQFITIEGGEGTGKSTLISNVSNHLSKAGFTIVTTREPGGTPHAERIRDIVLNPPDGQPWSSLAQALLMNTARQDHLDQKIRPALARGDWVICDRFLHSTRAYQTVAGVALSVLKQLEDIVVDETRPDLTLLLDAEPRDLLVRRDQRGTDDAFERLDLSFHNQVRERFLMDAKADPDRVFVLDALDSPERLTRRSLDIIEQHLNG